MLTEPTDESVVDDLANAVSDVTYTCGRVWSAWGYGTMTEDDFTDASQDEEWLYSTVEVVRDSLQPPVDDAESLTNLPVNSIVTCNGKAFTYTGNYWTDVGSQMKYFSSSDLLKFGKVRVIHFENNK